MKKLVAVLMTLVMALALVACGKDDESETDSLIGTWKATAIVSGGDSMTMDEYAALIGGESLEYTMEVKEDGTIELVSNLDDVTNTSEGTWEAADDGYSFTANEETVAGYIEDGTLYMGEESESSYQIVLEKE